MGAREVLAVRFSIEGLLRDASRNSKMATQKKIGTKAAHASRVLSKIPAGCGLIIY